MAQVGPATTDDTEGQLAISDTQLAAQLFDYLRQYKPTVSEPARDTFKEHFRIELASRLPEFDMPSARAYAATDLLEPSHKLFALVCDVGSVQRHKAIAALKKINNPYVLRLIEAGVILLSQPDEERFVIFYERPEGIRMSDFLARNTSILDTVFLCQRIIAPLAGALNEFAEAGISHGTLNADNVYFKDYAMLGPCVTGPCGVAQPFYYESLERMQCVPAGKGEGTVAQDFYALAVLMLHALHGAQHFTRYTPELLARQILREGVYNAMMRIEDIPEAFFDFFRGMLSQNSTDRWGYKMVKLWLDGKRFNVLSPPAPVEAVRPFDFGDIQINTRRELAHIFAVKWEQVPEHIQGGKLNHWAAVSLRNKELSENIARVVRAINDTNAKNDMQLGEQIMRLIMILDPVGPIRFRQLAFNIDGVEGLFAELFNNRSQQELQILLKYLEFSIASYWLELQRRDINYVVPPALNTLILRMDRLRTYTRNTGMGFGIERILYDLNPEMPCRSPYLARWHITTLPALLKRLDQLAPQLAKDNEPMDRHIAAFIASKTGLQHEIKLHDLSAMPNLATHRAFIAMYLLTGAQQKAGSMDLPGLSHWLALRVLPMLETLSSSTLRTKIKSLLVSRARSGKLTSLAELVLTSDYASADINGFRKARQLYHANSIKILHYHNERLIEQRANAMGFKIAKFFSYCALMVTLFNAFGGRL